jgi:DNA-binding NarL/FixJ family response regulator
MMAEQQQPDLCVLDLAMPGAAPEEGVRRFRALAPRTRIVVTTGLEDSFLAAQLEQIGIDCFVSKQLDPEALLAAIEEVMAGRPIDARSAARLPPRQLEVLRLIAHGLTNKEIAVRLGIAPATVKVHVAALLGNLGASNRAKAVAQARSRGLV